MCTGPANNDPTTNTFEAILFSTGGFLLAYPEMNDTTGTCRGPPSPIGYENQDGSVGVQISYDEVPASGTQYYIPPSCTAPGVGEVVYSVVSTSRTTSVRFVVGEPMTVTFTDAQSCNAGDSDCLWDDWVGIYPVATCCEYEQLLNYVGGDGTGEWAYHGTADLGAGSVTVVPTQATDYYVLLLGGADGYTELTDPDNRVMVTVVAGSGPNDGHLWSGDYLTSDITFTDTSVDGYVTYQISVTLGDAADDVYAIWGSIARPLNVPAAYQVAAPFGADVGGVNPLFFASTPDASTTRGSQSVPLTAAWGLPSRPSASTGTRGLKPRRSSALMAPCS